MKLHFLDKADRVVGSASPSSRSQNETNCIKICGSLNFSQYYQMHLYNLLTIVGSWYVDISKQAYFNSIVVLQEIANTILFVLIIELPFSSGQKS